VGRLARWIGFGVLIAVGMGLLAAAWVAVAVLTFEQVEDPASVARKAAALKRLAAGTRPGDHPNVVLILFDDLGLGDLGVTGSRILETPRIDALAAQGVVLDPFYTAAPNCTPSRVGFLTGRYPVRSGLTRVVFPDSSPIAWFMKWGGATIRLPADEITLADALRAGGYATGMVGKWHLGHESPSLPTDMGFDSYFGLLHSNDMSPVPLWRNEEIVEPHPIDQSTLTPRYTREAVAFIDAHAGEPFFLYLAHSFPHIPLYTTAEQAGQSRAGLYGDVIADLDRSVGAVLDALERNGIGDETLVLVTSDNGPWFQGSPAGVRGRKNDTFEGGHRVPFIARLPGRIPAGGRISDVAMATDVLPTVLSLAGVPLPDDRIFDGADLLPVLEGLAQAPQRPVHFYSGVTLEATRLGRFKHHARKGVYGGTFGLPFALMLPRGPWLIDMQNDPDESYDVSSVYPEQMDRLEQLIEEWQEELASNPRGWLAAPPAEAGP
jgi:uncharacterized sulfatase